MGMAVSDARVDEAIDEIAARVKMTPTQLTKALAEQGVDIETLRATDQGADDLGSARPDADAACEAARSRVPT